MIYLSKKNKRFADDGWAFRVDGDEAIEEVEKKIPEKQQAN